MNRSDGWTLSRREALALMGAAAVATQTSSWAAEMESKAKAGIALQLYTVRDAAKADLEGTLKKAREIGWEYVQWSGMPDLPAEKIREALDKAGLKAIAAHTSVESFEKDFDTAVAFWKTVGCKDVAPGGMMDDCRKTLKDWIAGCKRLDAVGAKLREAGMRLSYHNHNMEFTKYPDDPRCKLDILLDETKPENVCAELDLAWVHVGGADPAAYIRKCKNRCPVIHAKDLAREKGLGKSMFAPLGEGILNWPDIFVAGRESGIEWYVYEQDKCDGDVFEAVKISYEFLKKNVG